MKVVVCVKQIPDPAVPGRLNPETNTLDRDDKLIIDDSDAYGVEMALQLVEAAGGGSVSLVSMVPRSETSGLRTALAMGAEDAVIVSDDALAGSDALGTAKVLGAAIARMDADLVLAGVESSDGYTGTVPEMIAGVMGLPSITFAKHIETDGATVKVQRQTEDGYDDVECALPAVVSVTAGVVEPRYPSFKGIMAAKKKTVTETSLADLGVPAAAVGTAGARQATVDVTSAEERQAGEIVVDEGEAHNNIVDLLVELKVV
ncbi:MAG TPA: electron transfer flavoprotein subunit alpha [Acidimicrobiaceae bacterium]|nr:electron transfer flavoprotein subunit alpha [Acidimicrobiaceae bacterium]